jgi:hypothetical protein
MKLKLRSWTPIFILLVIAAIIIYDALAIGWGEDGASITNQIGIWLKENSAVGFALGYVMGHLTWPAPPVIPNPTEEQNLTPKL